jgi:lysophospholipase L1-like esterase
VLLLGIFPRGDKPNPQREKIAAVNAAIAKLDDGKMVHYLDIGPKFLQPDGSISKEIMPDYLHLSPKGYDIWTDAVEAKVDELMKK